VRNHHDSTPSARHPQTRRLATCRGIIAGSSLGTALCDQRDLIGGRRSGMCNAAGIGGLPVAAFLTAQPIAAQTFRATMIVYLTGLDLITIPLMWHGGLVTWDTAIGAACALPFLGLGIWLGGRKFTSTSPEGFRKFAIAILLILSLLGVARIFL